LQDTSNQASLGPTRQSAYVLYSLGRVLVVIRMLVATLRARQRPLNKVAALRRRVLPMQPNLAQADRSPAGYARPLAAA
jgi:hypothetical protein